MWKTKQNPKHNKTHVIPVMEKTYDAVSCLAQETLMSLLVHRKRSPLLESVLDIEILWAV